MIATLFNSNLTPIKAVIHFLISVIIFALSLSVHEFAHAFAAYKCGDKTAKLSGRMTLNPFKHLDLFGFLMFIFLGVGWAKPVPINPINFRRYKKGVRLVSISGVLANLTLALVAAIALVILAVTVGSGGLALSYVYSVLIYTIIVNGLLFMFNILPIPPLDGFNFVSSFTKPENKFINYMLKNGFRILIGIILIGFVTELFGFNIFSLYLSLLSDGIFGIVSLNNSVYAVLSMFF